LGSGCNEAVVSSCGIFVTAGRTAGSSAAKTPSVAGRHSNRSADLSCRSAAFSFKSWRSHRLGKARDQWSGCAGSPVRRHRVHRDVAQRSPSSVAALPSRRALGGAERATAAGKAAGLESEPCATAAYQIRAHGDGAILKDRTPQPGHAIDLPPCRAEAMVNRAGERWRARKTADQQDRFALRWLWVNFNHQNYGGYSSSEFDVMINQCHFFRLVASLCLLGSPVQCMVTPGRGPTVLGRLPA
jgi:hypothetical protein